MATQRKQTPTQPAEDMFGRPIPPRNEGPAEGPSREQQAAQQTPVPARQEELNKPSREQDDD